MTDVPNNTFQRLRSLLGIPELGGEDWDLIFADSDRVAEFCDVYERALLSASDRTALMELIVASYDRFLSEATTEDTHEARITNLLEQDFALHKNTVEYWSKLNAHDPQSLWQVSLLMRRILQQNTAKM